METTPTLHERDAEVGSPASRGIMAASGCDMGHDLSALATTTARIASLGTPPPYWRFPGFANRVDTVRRQLAPLRSREMLAAAYARESERLARVRDSAASPTFFPHRPSAMDLAYTVRWLELSGDAWPPPPWPAWLVWLALEAAAARSANPR